MPVSPGVLPALKVRAKKCVRCGIRHESHIQAVMDYLYDREFKKAVLAHFHSN
jgi:hypothetical protein